MISNLERHVFYVQVSLLLEIEISEEIRDGDRTSKPPCSLQSVPYSNMGIEMGPRTQMEHLQMP
jgi:hypothetical protein